MKNFSIFGDYEYSADALKIERKNSSINFQFNKSIQEEVVEELIEFWNSLSHFSINRITLYMSSSIIPFSFSSSYCSVLSDSCFIFFNLALWENQPPFSYPHFPHRNLREWKEVKKNYKSPRVIYRGTSAHFCVSDQYLISKLMRTN